VIGEEVLVATTASAPGETVKFTRPNSLFADQDFDAKWTAAGARYPQKGDQALALEDEDGVWWLLSWADQPAVSGGSGLLAPVVAARTSPLPAAVYDNGADGVGATLQGAVNGALPAIDGVTLEVGDRVLIAGQ
jgi:hypothetical protein